MELTSPTEFAKQKVLVVQEYTFLAAQSVANLFRKPLYFADMVQQADLIGVGSLPIVVLTGFFTGGVLALQTANTLQRFGSITLIGQLVSTYQPQQALARLSKSKIDALIVDCDLNGSYQFLREVQSIDTQASSIPLVIMGGPR